MSDVVEKVKAEIGAPSWRGWSLMEDAVDRYEINVDDLSQVMHNAWHTSQTDGSMRNGWDAVADAVLAFLPADPTEAPTPSISPQRLREIADNIFYATADQGDVDDLQEMARQLEVSVEAEARREA